ncbi:MAG TPA: metalloenzyme [Anaerolineae bacterium]|nr:metalloenzyme [Anaerolineae bacterium]
MNSLLYIFLDGVGLGPDSADNPFASAATPQLQAWLGRQLIDGPEIERDGLLFRGIDARLGVDGLPQSATGQTALFTGVNAAQAVGMHIATYPTRSLREIIAEHSLFKRAAEAGRHITFANPFHALYWQAVQDGHVKLSATTLAMQASGVAFRDLADLERGEAVFWDITHEIARLGSQRPRVRRAGNPSPSNEATTPARPTRGFPFPLPPISPEEAGRRLAALAAKHDLTLYESFLTDLAGHRRLPIGPEQAIATIDAFLGAIFQQRAPGTTLVLTSDHGNLETRSFKGHTLNPVPLLVAGPAVEHFRHVRDITQVAPAILRALGVEP